MHPIIENILDRPLSHRVGILGGSVVLVIIIGWFMFLAPALDVRTELVDEIEKLSDQIATERRLAMNLPRFRAEVKDLDIKLKFALQELPDEREIPDLLASISNLARDSGLDVQLFKPRPESLKEFYAEVPVEIDVIGSFHQVASFFDEVGQLSRIVNIGGISVREPQVKDEFVSIKVNLIATTFRYLSEAERDRMKSQSDKGSRGKRRR